jgi:hypothetical protein
LQFVRGRLVRRRPVVPNRPDRRGAADRDQGKTLHEGFAIGIERHAWVGGNIRDGDGRAILHDPAAHAGFEREALSFPERADRVFIDVVAHALIEQNESRAVGPRKVARRVSDDFDHLAELASQRQRLHRGNQPKRRIGFRRRRIHREAAEVTRERKPGKCKLPTGGVRRRKSTFEWSRSDRRK